MTREPLPEFQTGDRVQTHPATDAWMSGDRYGEVVGHRALRVRVKLDTSGRTRAFWPHNLILIERQPA